MGIAFDPSKQPSLVDLAVAELVPQAPRAGHGRGKVVYDDRRSGNEAARGVPIMGHMGGVILGTRPGDSAAELERAGRDIVRQRLHRNRFKRS
jgi:hypothetical protein